MSVPDYMRRSEVPWDVVDKNIIPLLRAVCIKYKTRMSCEGHLNLDYPHPWVDLETNQNYEDIQERLHEYNSTNKIGWDLHESHFDSYEKQIVRRLMPECRIYPQLSDYMKETMNSERLEKLKQLANECPPLEILQESSKDLARYLKESWK
ncbi:MAG: hypothetical protein KAJ24_06800 [Candidatus Aenigmarchaeota archaeon]|nr:hypothetical protein [Candidatus Aenigmarchaeota archaeon]